MSMNLGRNKLIKEFKIEISKTGELRGYMDLVYLGKIPLTGDISKINDSELFAPFSEKLQKKFKNKLPLKLHFKTIDHVSQTDDVWADSGFSKKPETPKDYFKNFEANWVKNAKVYAIQIEGLFTINIFGSIGPPYSSNSKFYDFRAGEVKGAKILKAKNVPGLKDVEK